MVWCWPTEEHSNTQPERLARRAPGTFASPAPGRHGPAHLLCTAHIHSNTILGSDWEEGRGQRLMESHRGEGPKVGAPCPGQQRPGASRKKAKPLGAEEPGRSSKQRVWLSPAEISGGRGPTGREMNSADLNHTLQEMPQEAGGTRNGAAREGWSEGGPARQEQSQDKF